MRFPPQSLLIAVAGAILFWLSSCRSNSLETNSHQQAATVADGSAILSETMGHFKTQSYSATVSISKVLKNDVRFDDVLRVYSKTIGPDHMRVLIMVKPQGERKGSGILAEIRNRDVVSAFRFLPETGSVVPVSSQQNFSHVVIGGLSLVDFQMVQGLFPFRETRITGREELNGKVCDVLEITFGDQSQYHQGQLFTTVAERLPVLMRAFDKEKAVTKEIIFDEVDRAGKAWIVKQLTVVEKTFNYKSKFVFENIQLDTLNDDSIFTVDFLQKGWQEPAVKGRS